MKTWKIITITLAAVLVVSIPSMALLAYLSWNTTPQTPYGSYTGSTMMDDSGYQSPRMDNTPMPYSNDKTETNLQEETSQQISSETPQLTNEEPPVLYTPQLSQFATTQYRGYGRSAGCMGGSYYGSNFYQNTPTTTLTIDQAITIAESYVNSLNNPDLFVEEVEEFAGNFYVQVKEESTGFGAFELLIDKSTGIVTPEMGPNMMWNTKYNFNSGYCNWFYGTATTSTPTLTVEQAELYAQNYLDAYYPGTNVDEATAFYGYYTFEVLSGSGIYGMLSVNSYTGQVWFHTWHGAFIQEVTVA
ncbi:MAG: hypothetical protein P8Y18_01575 [Candidatus Bathyarchaeota archaeon]